MKSIVKFAALIIGVTLVALAILYGMDYLEYRKSPEYQALKQYEEFAEQYENDPYGGSTPEETLQLFIDALKKEDIELASKYFVLDKQDEMRGDLLRLQQRNLVDKMLLDLDRAERGKDINTDSTRFIVFNERSEVITTINVVRGPSGRWKLLDF